MYACFITDDRYSVPSLSFRAGHDDDDIRRLARQELAASPHHQSIEVRDGDRVVFTARRETTEA